jgi:hypothetical protein
VYEARGVPDSIERLYCFRRRGGGSHSPPVVGLGPHRTRTGALASVQTGGWTWAKNRFVNK